MSLVVFRADAGPGIGAGHVMRCLAFAEVLSDMGWSARFVSNVGAAETVLGFSRLFETSANASGFYVKREPAHETRMAAVA